jgi:hypothetical protein
VLSPDEIRAVWTELEHPEEFGFSTDSATALRLILATTARPGMVCGMMHNELVDLEAAQPKPVTHGQLRDVTDGNGPLRILPHERMKRDDENTEPFIVPMNAMAVSLIQATKMAGGRVLRACKPGGAKQNRGLDARRCREARHSARQAARLAAHGLDTDSERGAAGSPEVPARGGRLAFEPPQPR